MLLIKNGYVIDPKNGREGKMDVLIEDKKIVKICPEISLQEAGEGVRIIEAAGKVVAPGLVDVHVHFRDPGFTYKEDISTGAEAAAKGGYTTVVLMANTKPVVDNEETLAYVREKGKETGIHVETCANITMGMKGQVLTDMEGLAANGAVGFTDDGIPLLDEEIVKEAMKRAKRLGKPLSFHEENPAYIKNNGVNAGAAARHYRITGSERMAEIDMVRRDIELAKETGADISIQHISAKEAVELVREAKKTHSNIFAEATPHHFTLTEEAVIIHGTLAKMNPPLREEEDRLAIIKGLQDGTIDMIATDHAPHSEEEKARSITEAPSGIIGLETALSLGLRELVEKGYLTMMELMDRMAYRPAKLYGLEAGYLEEGGPADVVIFDKEEIWKAETYASKSSNTPFTGEAMPGKVYYTICGGEIVYSI
ncbi:dihydroorotase [Kineothrix sp. MB12-C1]|uniref:dihydroorotase n=1 Tax=Kineothrix sp. MB12-C1 TaxID=3070215 RepID=UPI0027D2EB90|nr:dihydroorotase [Kineothrix sp. MB12-C1]WMC94452.1 dihydroorotase [Kineothrix sp. MB12-C1]